MINDSQNSNGRRARNPKSRQQKIDMLQSRRWKIVLKELIQAIKDSKAADVTVDLVDLILIFGTDFRRSPVKNYNFKRGVLWTWLDKCRKNGYPLDREVKTKETQFGYTFERRSTQLVAEKNREEALWNALKPVICEQLAGFYKVSDIVADDVVTDIRRVAALINYPVEARKGTADFTLRVPRTWGKRVDPHTLLAA